MTLSAPSPSPSSSSSSSLASRPSRRPPSLLSSACLVVCLLLAASQPAAVSAQGTLRSGLSSAFSAPAGGWSYFSFVNTIAEADVVLGLTAFAGDPDIYYVRGDSGECANPTLQNYTDRNDAEGGGVLSTINVPQGAKFCIGIYASGGWEADGRVLVVASSDVNPTLNPTQLQNGEPTNDVLRGGKFRYYQFVVTSPPPQSISLSITKPSGVPGDPDMYVNHPDNRTFPTGVLGAWKYATQIDDVDIITVTHPASGIYYITVYAFLVTTQYQIIVVSSDGTVELADGISYPMSLTQNTYAYYSFRVPSDSDLSTRTLLIAANPVRYSGDLSIYCSAVHPNPSREPGQYEWSSASSGADVVVISGSTGALRAGMVYCAVYAETNVQYHITAQFRAKTALEDGKSVREYLPANSGMYFTFDVNASAPVDFTVSTLTAFGQHSLYVSPANGDEPNHLNRSTYAWFNVDQGNNRGQAVNVPRFSCPATAPNHRCRYTILVWATRDTSFDLVAVKAGTPQELNSGQVVYGFSFFNQYSYFSFRVTDPRSNVTIILTSTEGDPVMFVSFSDPHPTPQVSDLQASSAEGQDIYFDWSSPIIASNHNGNMVGTYYIAVYGRTPSIWDIRVKIIDAMNPAGGFPLKNGQPVQSRLPHGRYDYYSFTTTPEDWPNSVIITLQPQSGNPDLYVGNTTALVKLEDRTTWTRSSANAAGNTDEVTYTAGNSDSCNPNLQASRTCTYHIAVYGAGVSTLSSYSLVAHTGNVNILLANGVSFEHSLRVGQSEYYTFANLHQNGTVVVMISPIQGDPGLYVSGVVTRPNATNHQYQSNNAGGDLIVIRRAGWGVYHIGVRSVDGQPARYTILATSYDPLSLNLNPVALSDGRSVPGFADYNEYRHYYYTLRNENVRKLTFFAERKLGDPDLYINRPSVVARYPNTTHADEGGTLWGSDVVVLRNANPSMAIATGTYRASVFSPNIIDGLPEPSQYVLTVLEGNSILQMSDGIPFQSELMLGEYDYFSFYVLPQTNSSAHPLSVTATSFGGDVDVSCSITNERPLWYLPDRPEWGSTSVNQAGSDNVLIHEPQPGTTYFCSAYGWTAGRYSMVMAIGAPIQLVGGMPMHMTQAVGSTQSYIYEMSYLQRQPIFISARPSQGRPYIYVSNTSVVPEIDNPRTYGSFFSEIEYDSTQTVWLPAEACSPVIAPGTDASLARCQYKILVYSARTALNWGTSYSITVETPNSPTTMEYGINYDAYLPAGEIKFYQFYITAARVRWSLQLTNDFGDPDLYVSRFTQQPGPPSNRSDAEWEAAYNTGLDHVTVDWNDRHYQGQTMAGTYYVAVEAYRPMGDVSYRLVLIVENEDGTTTPVVLEQGVPQSRALAADSMSLFRFYPGAEGWPYVTIISVVPTSGDPNLYVGRNFMPNRTTHTYLSTVGPGLADTVYIVPNGTNAQQICNPTLVVIGGTSCYYGIAVHSAASSHFHVLVTTMNNNGSTTPVALGNGQTLQGISFRGGYTLYYHFVSRLGNTVVFSVTPLTGNPDLYVSSNQSHPTMYDYQERSNSAGGDMIVIRNATSRIYFLAVHAAGFQASSSFFVTASSYDPSNTKLSVPTLTNGVQIADFGAQGDYKYFKYELTEPVERLTIGVVPRRGDADLFINLGRDSTGTPRWPAVGSWDWRSQNFNSEYDVLGINNPQLGEYFIGVQAFYDTSFSIMAVRSGTSVAMVHGVVYPGSLTYGQYQYYQFYVAPEASFASKTLTFSLGTLGANDPDLYCSDRFMFPNHTANTCTPGPTGVNCSATQPPNEIVTYSGENGQLHAGTYYCGVRAYTRDVVTTYILSGYLSDRVTLQDGEPLDDSVAAGQPKYYRLVQQNGAAASDIVVITQVDESGGAAYLYINKAARGDPEVDGDPANPPNWVSTTGNGWRHQQITIPASECSSSTAPCQYNVAVYSPVSRGPAAYTIVAVSARGQLLLTPSVPYSDSVQLSQSKYYRFVVADPRANVTVQVDSGAMDVDMYISRVDQYPSPSSPEGWVYGDEFGELRTITTRDPNYGVGTWYVTVFGYQPAAFTIYVTLSIPNEPTLLKLSDGQAIRDSAVAGQWKYYTYEPTRFNWPYTLYFRLTPLRGDPDLGVRVTDGFYPTVTVPAILPQTPTNWGWVAGFSGSTVDQVSLLPNQPYICNPNATVNVTRGPCSYTIGVWAYTPSGDAEWYLVVSSTSTASLTELTNGVTVGPYTLGNNQWSYYFFRATTPGFTVAFSLIAVRGNPDIYVSTVYQNPNQTNAQWRSSGASHDNVLIQRTNSTIYYVAIHSQNQQGGQGASEYTLTARIFNSSNPTASILPIDRQGLAYADTLAANTYRYWSFTLSGIEQTEYITFTVKALSGNPDVYINYRLTPVVFPTNSSSQWGSRYGGDDIISIPQPAHGEYIIGVHVTEDTFYTITVTTAGSVLQVSAGEAYSGELQAGQSNYYRYNLQLLSPGATLSFAVTPEYGNPDLYVSDVVMRPNRTSARWMSDAFGTDVITITNNSQVHTGQWYATVHAMDNTAYTFSVSYGGTNNLIDCSAWGFSLGAQGTARYTLTVPGSLRNDTTDTQVQVSLGSGYTSIYLGVNTVPNAVQPNSYRLSLSQAQAQASPNVLWTVPRAWCFGVTDCVINLLLWNNVNNPNLRASGSVLVSSGACATTLQAGVSVAGTVTFAGESNAHYYKFRVPTNFVNVTVRLTMTNNGNVDLYCSSRVQKPGYAVSEWSSTQDGDDEVYFDWTDPSLAGVRMAERYYYCAVMRPEGSAALQSSYNILFTFVGESFTFIQLEEGIPIERSLRGNNYMYFRYTPSPANYPYSVFIQLTAIDGGNDPDMYVRNDGQLPSELDNTWEAKGDSISGSPVELIPIAPDHPLACSLARVQAGTCTYIIAVMAWEMDAKFQILVDTSNPNTYTRLTSGNSVQGVVSPMQWHYYSFEVVGDATLATNTTLASVHLQALGGGNPDLYVQMNARPNTTWYNQSSTLMGSDLVQWIATRGRYIVGVYNNNATSAASYYVTETLGPIRLMNGQGQEDTLLAGQQRRYDFVYSSFGRNTLTIDVTGAGTFTGLNIYVRVGGNWSSLSTTSYTWTVNLNGQTAGTVTVLPTDPNYSPEATYHVLVVATQRSTFTITAADGSVPLTLVPGQTYPFNNVAMGDYRYFRGVVSNTENDLVITATVTAGGVSIYASAYDRTPSSLAYNYTATTSGGFAGQKAISVVIPRSQIRSGYYYFSVRTDSTTPASYNVRMTTSQVTLTSAISQEAMCSSPTRYYRLVVQQAGQDVNFLITPSNWQSASYTGRFHVYVSRVTPYPTAESNQWNSGTSLTMSREWTIHKDDNELQACISEGSRFGMGCTLYVATACQPPTAAVSYLFTATVGKSIVPLIEGSKREVALTQAQSDYYVSYVQSARAIWLMAEPCRGQVRLDVSMTNRQPSPAAPGQWSSAKAGAPQSVVIYNSTTVGGVYYSGVRAMEAETVYRMVQVAVHEITQPQTVMTALTPRPQDGTELSLWRDDENVHVQFSRAKLPSHWKSGVYRYTLRYFVHLAPQSSPWIMYTECGLNHTMQVARLNDLELLDDVTTIDLSFPAAQMNQTDDPLESYKINVIAQVWQQPMQGGSYLAHPIQWTAYTPVMQQKLEDVYWAGPGGRGVGPGPTASVLSGPMVAMYILLPIAFFIALIAGHYYYKRRRSTPIPLDLFNTSEAELAYQKHKDTDDTHDGVYTNGGTNGTNGAHTNGTKPANGTTGANGHSSRGFAADEYENERKEGPAGSVEVGDAGYVANPTPVNNFYTQ